MVSIELQREKQRLLGVTKLPSKSKPFKSYKKKKKKIIEKPKEWRGIESDFEVVNIDRTKKRRTKLYSKKTVYNEYLQSKDWKRLRGIILLERKCFCEKCLNTYTPSMLHVHHKTYIRFKHERKTDLSLLCKKCHVEVHKYPRYNIEFFIT